MKNFDVFGFLLNCLGYLAAGYVSQMKL